MEPVMAYPFTGPGVEGTFVPKSVHEVYVTSIRNILTTVKGSIRYAPKRGSSLPTFVFDLNDDIGKQLIQFYALNDIQEQEPRLVIVALEAEFDVENYKVGFTVTFVEADDPDQVERQASIKDIGLRRI